MDSGSSATLIHRSRLPPGCIPTNIAPMVTQTTAGNFHIAHEVLLQNIQLPEFGKSLQVLNLRAYVFDAPCRFDLIMGRDFMVPNGFDIKFSSQTMEWIDRRVLMKQNDATTPVTMSTDRPELADLDFYYARPTDGLLPSKYEGIESLDSIVRAQTHLSENEQNKHLKVLQGFGPLFEGKLG